MAERETESLSVRNAPAVMPARSPDRRESPHVPRRTWRANGGGTRGWDRRPGVRAAPWRRPAPEKTRCRAPKRRAAGPIRRERPPVGWRRKTPDKPTRDRRKRHNAAPTVRPTNKIGRRTTCRPARPARSLQSYRDGRLRGRSTQPPAAQRRRIDRSIVFIGPNELNYMSKPDGADVIVAKQVSNVARTIFAKSLLGRDW